MIEGGERYMNGQIEGGNVEGCIKFKLFINTSILHLVLLLSGISYIGSVMTSILKLME